MATTTVTAEEQIGLLNADIAQLNGQIAVYEQRVKELSGFQAEAVASREAVTNLQEKLDASDAALAAAVKDANQARAASSSAAALSAQDASLILHAKNLAAAVKAFS